MHSTYTTLGYYSSSWYTEYSIVCPATVSPPVLYCLYVYSLYIICLAFLCVV